MIKNLPDYLGYPKISSLDDIPEINNQFVYVIKDYGDKGYGSLVYRNDDNVYLRFGDFNGKLIDVSNKNNKHISIFTTKYLPKVLDLMKTTRITQAIYYFTGGKDDITLADMRLSLNKFSGPGMLRDLFSKIIPTQEVIKTVTLNKETIDAIKAGTGSFDGNIVLKTSVFKTINRTIDGKQHMLPMYARIKR